MIIGDNIHSARNAVTRAVRAGDLVRQPCRRCGAPKAVARHEDFSKPLDVTWLCYKCHAAGERGDFRSRPQRRSLNLVLPLEILEGIAAAAAKRNQSRAKTIEIVLRDWLRDQGEAA